MQKSKLMQSVESRFKGLVSEKERKEVLDEVVSRVTELGALEQEFAQIDKLMSEADLKSRTRAEQLGYNLLQRLGLTSYTKRLDRSIEHFNATRAKVKETMQQYARHLESHNSELEKTRNSFRAAAYVSKELEGIISEALVGVEKLRNEYSSLNSQLRQNPCDISIAKHQDEVQMELLKTQDNISETEEQLAKSNSKILMHHMRLQIISKQKNRAMALYKGCQEAYHRLVFMEPKLLSLKEHATGIKQTVSLLKASESVGTQIDEEYAQRSEFDNRIAEALVRMPDQEYSLEASVKDALETRNSRYNSELKHLAQQAVESAYSLK